MHVLPTRYRKFFDLLLNHPEYRQQYALVYFVALDTEWYESAGRNVVLSYQYNTASRDRAENVIEYVAPGERRRLSEVVEGAIASVHDGQLPWLMPGERILVILIAHYFAAEWSALADRDEPHITRKLTVIRKTPVTGLDPIQLHLSNYAPVDVRVYDTKLLAPATHQNLKALSSLLGPGDGAKEEISQFHLANMNVYLQDDPEGFERYALRDTEITLKLFFLLQESLNMLACGEVRQLFRTLASAAVEGFLEMHPWFPAYLKARRQNKFWDANRLIERAYHGGRNESYFVGNTADYPETRDKVWVDIDFAGCYPTAMALCPRVETRKKAIKYLPLAYRIDDAIAARLEQDLVAPTIIEEARVALTTALQAFEHFLKNLPSRKLAWHLRQRATVVDNCLILDWQRRWNEARSAGDTGLEKYIIPGFARVHFQFPEDCLYPCLPVRHPHFGLIYPLEGDTDATASEILLALEAGAKIEALTSVELPVRTDKNGRPVRFFLNHLRKLLAARAQYKKDKKNPASVVMEKLCKEFANSFYGKFAQGVNPRSVVQVSGESEALGPSKLTESSVAAMATGLPRAALSAVLLAIERYNAGKTPEEQITAISATTDGLLIGLPAPAGYTVVGDYYTCPTPKEMAAGAVPELIEHDALGNPNAALRIENVLERFGCGELLPLLDEYLPIRQMRRSREDLTDDETYLEVKHLADQVHSIKTRGQLLILSTGHCSHAAKFGHKPPLSELVEDGEEYKRIMEAGGIVRHTRDADWILDQIERQEVEDAEIPFYDFINLTGFKEMLESEGRLDMTKKIEERQFNADFDWKRRLVWRDMEEK